MKHSTIAQKRLKVITESSYICFDSSTQSQLISMGLKFMAQNWSCLCGYVTRMQNWGF